MTTLTTHPTDEPDLLAPVPTSGSGRRRAKAIARRGYLHELDVRWAFRLDRLPRHAVAASVCSCGRMSWLMPGASDEDREAFDRDNADHADMCSEVDW